MSIALQGLRVIDISGTIATSYCAKLWADYGAEVINLEPAEGFQTRILPPFILGTDEADKSAMHAYLSTNKLSLNKQALGQESLASLLKSADLVLDDNTDAELASLCPNVRASISWYGNTGEYSNFIGSDAQCFALNGMLRGIGHVEGPPLIPTGYQAQIVGGLTSFIGSMVHVLAGELGNRHDRVEIDTSIFEACLCFTDVGAVSSYNTNIQVPRLGINRFPPTYPLGVFPCRDGWIGVTVLTPSQWQTFCQLLDIVEYADVELFQTAIGRLQSIDILEPVIRKKLLEHSAEELFYRAQENAVPLARVPTMEELFGIDQFLQRHAFAPAILPGDIPLLVPTVPFRLYRTPPSFAGPVASVGEHTESFQHG
ncbi:MAG: CaiB/BaiF CoA-transferase family protein [bacterium]|nr:CoA transferase [Gammaproteobacteria bacterium]